MVLLVAKITKIYSKLENHHHHHPSKAEILSASLEAFRSEVSNSLNKLSLNSKPISQNLSFSLIQQCFDLISVINKAFAKLVIAIDYPISKWEASSIEQYLKYSLSLLELFNSINSCLSRLGQARLSLSHALSLVEKQPSSVPELLKPIQPLNLNKELLKPEEDKKDGKEKFYSNNAAVVHEAVVIMQSLGFSFCGFVLSALCGDPKPYSEMRKFGGGLASPLSARLDSSISEVIVEEKVELMEVKELNNVVACLVGDIVDGKSSELTVAKELEEKLKAFEKMMEDFKKKVDQIFNEVMAGRNQLLNGFRQRKE